MNSQSSYSKETTPYNYVLISGSYRESTDNDIICKILGAYLSKLDIGLISGAGKAGMNVSTSFCRMLDAEDKYDVDRILFYLRRKERDFKAVVNRIGSVKFDGDEPLQMRKKMIAKARAVIVIGGETGTLQEEQLATLFNVPVIPIARTGGAALEIWKKYKARASSLFPDYDVDNHTFEALDNKNIHAAIEATIELLKKIISVNAESPR